MRFSRILSLFLLLAGAFLLPAAFADVVKLKDGTVVEGQILEETDTQVRIRAEYAGGTILKTETIEKSNIAEIERLTPEQQRERAITRDYEKLQAYKLNPSTSYPVAYYDQVIEKIFQKHLTDFPDSPFAGEIQARIRDWQSERNQVAAGTLKVDGRWISADEAARVAARKRAEDYLSQAQELLTRGEYDRAIRIFRGIRTVTDDSALIGRAWDFEREAMNLWVNALEAGRAELDAEMQRLEARKAEAQQELHRAQAGSSGGSNGGLGQTAFQMAISNAQVKVQTIEREMSAVRARIAGNESLVSDLRARLEGRPAAPPESLASTGTGDGKTGAPAEPLEKPYEPPFLVELGHFLKKYWYVVLVLALLGVYWLAKWTRG